MNFNLQSNFEDQVHDQVHDSSAPHRPRQPWKTPPTSSNGVVTVPVRQPARAHASRRYTTRRFDSTMPICRGNLSIGSTSNVALGVPALLSAHRLRIQTVNYLFWRICRKVAVDLDQLRVQNQLILINSFRYMFLFSR